MKDTDPDRRGELTDAQLDQLLAETNRELLEHVGATSDPGRTLTAIMDRNAEQGRPARGIRRAAHGLSAGAAAAVIMSDRIRAFASAAAVTSDTTASRALIAFTAAAAAMAVLALGTVAGWPMIATAPVSATGFAIAAATIRHGFASRQGRGRDPGQALAAIMRSRSGARAIVRILADRGYRGDGVIGVDRQALTMARDLARELARDLARGDELPRDLIAALDVAISQAGRLDLTLMRVNQLPDSYQRDEARASAIDLDRQLRRYLAAARRVGRDLASALDERQVDVSGADLSKMNINPHLLNGAIWTHQTSWPPGVAGQVRAHSTEIRPDVYQVRLGNTPDRDFLTLS